MGHEMTVQNNLLGKIACNICNDMPYLQEVWDDECLCHPHWSHITVIWYLSIAHTNDIGWLHNYKVISNMGVMKNAKLEPSLSTNISVIWFLSIVYVNMLGCLYSDMVYLQHGCYEEQQVRAKPCHKHYTDMVSPHCGCEYARVTLQWHGLSPVWMLWRTPS